MPRLTIFTPTYNRGHIIHKLFESLLRQTNKDFVWVVIDDGSDDTGKKMAEWIRECNSFQIIYKKKPSDSFKGLHSSLNLAVKSCNTELFIKVDDDDYLDDDAVERIFKMADSVWGNPKFAGVSGLKTFLDGKIIGHEWTGPKTYIDATNLERSKYGLDGDKAEVYFTKILKKFEPLPEFEDETHPYESILWDEIAHAGYKIRWFNEPFYHAEYLPDGVTAHAREAILPNFKTYTVMISKKMDYKEISLKSRLMLLCRYCEFAKKKGLAYSRVREDFKNHRKMLACSWIFSEITKNIKRKSSTKRSGKR